MANISRVLGIYTTVSIMLFSYSIAHCIKKNYDLEQIVAFFEDPGIHHIIFLNIFVSLSVFFSYFTLSSCFWKISEYSIQAAFISFITDPQFTFQRIISPYAMFIDPRLASRNYLLFVEFLILQLLSEMRTLIVPVLVKSHQRISALHLLMLAISFLDSMRGLNADYHYASNRISFATMARVIYGIYDHFSFIANHKNYGNSIRSVMKCSFVRLLTMMIVLFYDLVVLLYRVSVRAPATETIECLASFMRTAADYYVNLQKYLKVKSIITKIDNLLPDVTEEVIKNDNICINCRDHMTIHDSKVLPCGHCLHTDCIQRYILTNTKCPICGTVIF